MARGSIQATKDLKSPVAPGIYYRLIGMTGNNKGTCYYLKGARVVIGRGEQTDIQIMDSKASREHAELTKVKNEFVVTDLGSQNGIIVNDLKVNQHKLADNDRIIIGQTIFKFQILNVQTELVEKKSDLAENSESDSSQENPAEEAKPRSMKKLLIMGAVLALGILAITTNPPTGSSDKKNGRIGIDGKEGEKNAANKPRGLSEEDKENEDKIRGLLLQGQRELREGNYFRAISAFQLATNLDPKNGNAQFYLNKSQQALDQEVTENFNRAARDIESLKFRSAIVSYCSVMRLLQQYTTNQNYIKAQNEIEKIEEKLGMDKGEIKCFESQ